MALLSDFTASSGIEVPNAYIRIDSVGGTKSSCALSVSFYISKEAYDSNKFPIQTEHYSFIPSVEDGAENFIKQGYEYLKTLGQFKNATDVLEG